MKNSPRVQLTPDGPNVSKLIQGYWRLADWNMSSQGCLSFIKNHVDLGVTTVDHAHVYGSPPCEELFGRALRLDRSLREQIEIISKCGIVPATEDKVGHYNSSSKSIVSSVECSLSLLGIESLDILLIHRPDYLTKASEIIETFLKLKSAGKVKHLGVSNFNTAQFELLQSMVDFPLVTNQIEINPLKLDILENGILDNLQQSGIHPMAWSCLAGGKIFNTEDKDLKRLNNVLLNVSEEIGAKSIDQTVLAWVMKLPCQPLPILGSGNSDRVKAGVESLSLTLNNEQWYRILVASKGSDVD